MEQIYQTPEWKAAREAALRRDADRCTIGHLFGGPCHPLLDAHHVVPLAEGGDPYDVDNLITTCHRHHPMLESVRRQILRRRWRRCPHHHRYRHAREACERRLNQQVA